MCREGDAEALFSGPMTASIGLCSWIRPKGGPWEERQAPFQEESPGSPRTEYITEQLEVGQPDPPANISRLLERKEAGPGKSKMMIFEYQAQTPASKMGSCLLSIRRVLGNEAEPFGPPPIVETKMFAAPRCISPLSQS